MNRRLRFGGSAVLALILLWVVLGVVETIVSWVLSAFVSLLVVAVLLCLAYLLVSNPLSRSGGRGDSRSRETEKIFE